MIQKYSFHLLFIPFSYNNTFWSFPSTHFTLFKSLELLCLAFANLQNLFISFFVSSLLYKFSYFHFNYYLFAAFLASSYSNYNSTHFMRCHSLNFFFFLAITSCNSLFPHHALFLLSFLYFFLELT